MTENQKSIQIEMLEHKDAGTLDVFLNLYFDTLKRIADASGFKTPSGKFEAVKVDTEKDLLTRIKRLEGTLRYEEMIQDGFKRTASENPTDKDAQKRVRNKGKRLEEVVKMLEDARKEHQLKYGGEQ